MRSAASTSCTTRSRSNTTACRCGRASRATRAAPSARWTSSTATASSRNGLMATRGWRPTDGTANDADPVQGGVVDYNAERRRAFGATHFITSAAEGDGDLKQPIKRGGVGWAHIPHFLYEGAFRVRRRPDTAKKIRVAFQDPCRSGRQM